MSNRHRKTIGTKKRDRNHLLRIVRGARKAGTPLPGHSRIYQLPNLAPAYGAHGDALRERTDHLLGLYLGASRN